MPSQSTWNTGFPVRIVHLDQAHERTIGAGLESRLSGTYRIGESVDWLRQPVDYIILTLHPHIP